MGFVIYDKAGQDKTVTLFCAWYCVVIYALYEALHCHAGKCEVRYLHEMINDLLCMNPVKAEQYRLMVENITWVS